MTGTGQAIMVVLCFFSQDWSVHELCVAKLSFANFAENLTETLQIITLSITGALNTVLSEQHKQEMRRYLYNHQARNFSYLSIILFFFCTAVFWIFLYCSMFLDT